MTADRRSVIFFSRLEDEEFDPVVAVDEEEEEEEEAHLSPGPPWLIDGGEMPDVNLVIGDEENAENDDGSFLASRVAMDD